MFLEIIDPDESFTLPIGKSTLDLRRLDPEKLREIRKTHTTTTTEFVDGRPVKISSTDDQAINEDILDYCIRGWGVVRHPVTKQPVPCTRENKLKLPGKAKLLVLNACNSDSAGEGEVDEEQQKNS